MKRSKIILLGVLIFLIIGSVVGSLIYTGMPLPGFESDPSKTTANADKDVNLRNSYEEQVEINLEILRDSTGQVVYTDTLVLNSGEKREGVYNFQKADPNGIESFNITSEYQDQERSVEIETDDCFGDTTIEVTSDGSLFPFYSTC